MDLLSNINIDSFKVLVDFDVIYLCIKVSTPESVDTIEDSHFLQSFCHKPKDWIEYVDDYFALWKGYSPHIPRTVNIMMWQTKFSLAKGLSSFQNLFQNLSSSAISYTKMSRRRTVYLAHAVYIVETGFWNKTCLHEH